LRDLSVVQQLLFIAERAPTQAVCESIEKNSDDLEDLALRYQVLREGIGIGRSWGRKSEEKIDTQQRKRI
jgi:hypothetical protein